jgi:phage/plasmid primase-like uncharacterized protein
MRGWKPDETLRDFKQRAAAADILATAHRLGAGLKRVGPNEWAGSCPVCGGTGGFSINTEEGRFACWTSGASGDVVAMVRHALALRSNIEAAQWINEPPQAGER